MAKTINHKSKVDTFNETKIKLLMKIEHCSRKAAVRKLKQVGGCDIVADNDVLVSAEEFFA